MQLVQVNRLKFKHVIRIYFVKFQFFGKSGAVGQHAPDVSKEIFNIFFIVEARNHHSEIYSLNLVVELGNSLKRKNLSTHQNFVMRRSSGCISVIAKTWGRLMLE